MKPLRVLGAAVLAALALPVHAIGSLADVTVYDRSTARELPVYWHEGRAYVVGKPGNEYQVSIRNRRGEDVLAVVSVDGINVMNGATAAPDQSGYVLSPWRRMDVRGWRKSMDEIASFYFTSLGDSYAARTDRPGNVGVIGVALFQRMRVVRVQPRVEEEVAPAPPPASSSDSWLKRENADAQRHAPMQAPEPAGNASAKLAAPSAPLGTGHGRREESRVVWVDFDRATSTPAETVTIYYDSYRNLLARGIIQTPYGQRDPSPFPNATFAPDPWR